MGIIRVVSTINLVMVATLAGGCMAAVKLNHLSPRDVVRKNIAAQMKSYMNISEPPCNDFYQYACGNWDAYHPLREHEDQINQFLKLESAEKEVWRKLLESPGNEKNLGDAFRKAKDFFKSCMDMEKIDQRGIAPLADYLNDLGGWPAIDSNWTDDGTDWLKLLVRLELFDTEPIIRRRVSTDFFNSSRNSMYVIRPVMTLVIRDYYMEQSKIFSAYKTYLREVLKELNVSEDRIEAEFKDILDFELKLMEVVLDDSDNGDYKATTLGVLQRNVSSIDWKRYLELGTGKSFNSSEQIIIDGDYLANLDTLLKSTPKRTITNYLGWHMAMELSPYIGAKFLTLRENLNAIASGRKIQEKPRLQRCVVQTMVNFEAALGSAYAERSFNVKAREDAKKFLSIVKDSFKQFIEDADWVDSQGKSNLKLKLENISLEVGYPDMILNKTKVNELYENITIKKDDYFGNKIKLRTSSIDSGWPIAFVSANAVYYTRNMYITAQLFQPPFYHKDLPKFLNFAGVGFLTAHELSHAFDTDNILYDHRGEANWISNATMTSYRKRERCFAEKYGDYTLNGVNLDGNQTLAETVADDAGIKAAFVAYQKWFAENATTAQRSNEQFSGFTESKEQMFFLSFAQKYCSHIRESSFSYLVQSDTHAVQKYRVNGVLSNLNSFSDAFGCPVGSAMNPVRKCAVW